MNPPTPPPGASCRGRVEVGGGGSEICGMMIVGIPGGRDGAFSPSAERKVSWVLRRVDCRLSPIPGRGGIGGCSWGEVSDTGDSISTVRAVDVRKAC